MCFAYLSYIVLIINNNPFFKKFYIYKNTFNFMERGVETFLEEQGYRKIYQRAIIALFILSLFMILIAAFYFFVYFKPCNDKACFIDSLRKCKRVAFVKEDAEAAWLYRIISNTENQNCNVEITLLKVKEGDLDSERLQAKKMICITPKTGVDSPEKDVSKCSGLLKEEMQTIIIERLHSYILQNIGEIKKGFESPF